MTLALRKKRSFGHSEFLEIRCDEVSLYRCALAPLICTSCINLFWQPSAQLKQKHSLAPLQIWCHVEMIWWNTASVAMINKGYTVWDQSCFLERNRRYWCSLCTFLPTATCPFCDPHCNNPLASATIIFSSDSSRERMEFLVLYTRGVIIQDALASRDHDVHLIFLRSVIPPQVVQPCPL